MTGCASAPPPQPAAPKAEPPPRTPLDLLPGGAFSLLHVDVDQIRTLLPQLISDELTAEQRALLARTHTVIVALQVVDGSPAVAAVLLGDYDEQLNPLHFTGAQAQRIGGERELWRAGGQLWLRTPEGAWVGVEASLADHLLLMPTAPSERATARLSAQAWTAAPSTPYFLSAALHVTPPLQRALEEVERDSMAALIAEAGPALVELRDVRLTGAPEGDGLQLSGTFDFASELGAKSGELVLRGLLVLMRSGLPEPGAGEHAPDSIEHAAELVMQAVDAAEIGTAGTRLRAVLTFDGPQLAALVRLSQHASEQAERKAAEAEARPAYVPPTAEQQAERERAARADKVFGKLIDTVIAQTASDVELRDGANPQTGKPGARYLVVHAPETESADVRKKLQDALKGKRLQVVPITRGFADRPTELGIFRAQDEASVLIALATGEAHAAGTAKRFAERVRSWQKRTKGKTTVQLAVAAPDYVAIELTPMPAAEDADRFVHELLELCPHAEPDQQLKQLQERGFLDCFLQAGVPVAASE